MSSAALTPPLTGTTRLVVDTDVASFIFKWHRVFAPRYVGLLRGCELTISFMTVAEMRRWALDANWGRRKRDILQDYLDDFAVLHSDDRLCSIWADIQKESAVKGHPIGSADAWIAATALLLDAPLV